MRKYNGTTRCEYQEVMNGILWRSSR